LQEVRKSLPFVFPATANAGAYFFFVIFILGNFRLTAATTDACSGFPELLAKASRA